MEKKVKREPPMNAYERWQAGLPPLSQVRKTELLRAQKKEFVVTRAVSNTEMVVCRFLSEAMRNLFMDWESGAFALAARRVPGAEKAGLKCEITLETGSREVVADFVDTQTGELLYTVRSRVARGPGRPPTSAR